MKEPGFNNSVLQTLLDSVEFKTDILQWFLEHADERFSSAAEKRQICVSQILPPGYTLSDEVNTALQTRLLQEEINCSILRQNGKRNVSREELIAFRTRHEQEDV